MGACGPDGIPPVDCAAQLHNDRPNKSARGRRARCGNPMLDPRIAMHEFSVLATFAVIAAVYVGLFLAAEKFFMK
jgi:hypothetical protein